MRPPRRLTTSYCGKLPSTCRAASPGPGPFFTSISTVLAEFVPAPPPDPSAPGVFRLAPPGELARVLRAGGLTDIHVEARPLVLTYDSLEDYWRIQTDLAAPLRAAISTLAQDVVERLKRRIFESLAPHMDGTAVRLAAVPLCASARRAD